MNTARQFYPPRRSGLIFHAGAILFLLAASGLGLWQASSASIGPTFLIYLLPALISVPVIFLLAYRAYALFSASYQLERDGLRLRWGLRSEQIPMDALVWVGLARDFPQPAPLPMVHWPGAILGQRHLPDGRSAEYLAARSRDLVLFLAHVELDFLVRATAFLREELGARTLVTNMNGWTNHATSQRVRSAMDYVDDHFYVDHPRFLEQSWRLPSRCPNTSPIAEGATGGRHLAFTRLFDKPFTVTEYNYSAPGRYRGVGGILTGALGAIQGWDGIWRFAYSHSRDNLFQPARLDYFNMATDPLSQAAERASLCLFLRGDMREAPHSVSIAMTEADFHQPPAQIPLHFVPRSPVELVP